MSVSILVMVTKCVFYVERTQILIIKTNVILQTVLSVVRIFATCLLNLRRFVCAPFEYSNYKRVNSPPVSKPNEPDQVNLTAN
jgi:hypothetical protein